MNQLLFETDFPHADSTYQSVPLIRSLLTQDRTTMAGTWFHTENASCLPAPVQTRLPIWVGGTGEKRTLRIAARYADGWNAAYIPPDEFRRLTGVLDEWCERERRDPATIRRGINLQFMVSADETSANSMRDQLRQQWGNMAGRVMAGSLSGAPNQAVERIAEYVDAGADSLNVALRAPWPEKSLDAWLSEVVPRVRALVP
jgi:alkanesulfonate monooxygenase SsuD/methylene tetrahydromethanopterin reductase-like flavin-dependent oxidoreductase (luciferase family)